MKIFKALTHEWRASIAFSSSDISELSANRTAGEAIVDTAKNIVMILLVVFFKMMMLYYINTAVLPYKEHTAPDMLQLLSTLFCAQ